MRSPLTSIIGAACVAGAFVGISLIGGGRDPGTADLVPAVHAQAPTAGKRCSARTLKGPYGIKYDGSTAAGDRYASVTLITFDGEGQFDGHDVFSLNGTFIRRTFSGPYTVNADCTGSLVFISFTTNPPHEARGEFVIVDGGQEFFLIDVEAGVIATAVGKRVAARGDSAQSE
jgi:hypothetical protein